MNTKMARRFKFFLMKISLANSDKFIGDFATAYRYKLCFGINAPQITLNCFLTGRKDDQHIVEPKT